MLRFRSTFALVCMAMCVLVSTRAHAANATLTVGSGTGTPGSTITISITLNRLTQPATGLQFTLIDTPNAVDVDTIVVAGQAKTAGFLLAFNRNDSTRTTVLFIPAFTNPPSILSPGLELLIAQITLHIHSGAQSGLVLLKLSNVVVSDTTANPQLIPTDLQDGILTITAGTPSGDSTPPAAPQGLITTAGNQRLTLRWTANSEADLAYYVLYRSLNNNFTPAPADSIARITKPTTLFTDIGLTNGTTYYYRLVAVDFSGNHSAPSAQTGGTPTPPDTTPPATPTGLTATAGDQQVRLQWTANSEADLAYYVLYRSIIIPTVTDSIARISRFQSAYTDTGLTNGTLYYYKLVAVDLYENHSAASAQVSGTPDVPPTVTAVMPPVGPVAGGLPIVIGGTNFQSGAGVTIGGAPSDSVVFLSSTRLAAKLPPGTPGQKDVTVINPAGTRGTLFRGFTYMKIDSVTVSLTVTANVGGTARTDTVYTARLPEGLPFIVPPKTAPITALQPLFDALAGLALEIPPGSIGQNINVTLDVRNVTIRNDSTIFASVNGKPSFFFVHPIISVNGVVQSDFDFSGRAALNLTLRLSKFGPILQASGVDTTAADTLALAYVTPSGLTQEGMISKSRYDDRLLIASLTSLADLAGIRQRDLITNTAPPTIVSGPFVVPADTFATVTWRTDKLSMSRVEFGTSPLPLALTQAVTDSQLVMLHAVRLGNLARQTKYYYRVKSQDDRGQTTISGIYFFSTIKPDLTPPVLTVKPQMLVVTPHTAIIGWITDEQSTSTVEYGTTPVLGSVKTHDALVIRHVIPLTGLAMNTTYYALVSSADGSGNVTAFPDTLTFTTPAVPDTLPPRFLSRPIVSGLTPTSAVIQWTTDVLSDGRVTYVAVGTTDTLRATNPDEPLTQQHTITLTGLSPGTPYLYRTSSTDASGNIATFKPGHFITPATVDTVPPVIVRGPIVLYASDRVIAIGWRTDEPSDGFVYYKGNTDNTFMSRGNPILSRRHFVVIGGLTPGVSYTFAISSTDPSGNITVFPPGTVLSKPRIGTRPVLVATSGLTVTTSSTPDVQPPVITGGPRVAARTSTSVTLTWETDESSDSQVQYGTGLNQRATDSDLVTTHQVTLTNLSPGTSYPFQVGSSDPSGNGPTWSAQGTATTATTADTEPPVILAGTVRTAVSNDRVTISWETDEPSDSFVQFGTTPSSLTRMEDEADLVTAHSVVLTNLTPNQPYYIRATSTDLTGNGPTATSTLTVTTTATADTTRPVLSAVQTSAVATTDTSATLTVTWQTDRLATSVVEYGPTSSLGSSVANMATGTAHQIVLPRLALNRTYSFRVGSASATDPQGTRLAYSAIMSRTTPAAADTTTPPAPTNVAAIPGNGAVRLRWTPSSSPSVTGYTILRNGTTLATVGRDSTFLDESATNGQVQTYRLQAVSALGKTSGLTASATATPNTSQIPTAPTTGSPAPGDTVSLIPTLVIGNASPVTGDPARATLTYGFQVAADSVFTTLIASTVGLPAGVAGNPTHWQVADPGLPGVSFLQGGVRYWWRARAYDGAFNGAWSASRTFVTSASKPTGITLASFAATEERGVVTLEWTIASGQEQAGFHVLRSIRPDGGYERISPAPVAGAGRYTYIDRTVAVNTVYYYRLDAVAAAEHFGPVMVRVSAPRQFALGQNYPNPFNPMTTIRYDLPHAAQVTLIVYNLLGQEVTTLVEARQEPGFYTVRWDGRNRGGMPVASGVYFYRLEAGNFVKTKKMTLVK